MRMATLVILRKAIFVKREGSVRRDTVHVQLPRVEIAASWFL